MFFSEEMELLGFTWSWLERAAGAPARRRDRPRRTRARVDWRGASGCSAWARRTSSTADGPVRPADPTRARTEAAQAETIAAAAETADAAMAMVARAKKKKDRLKENRKAKKKNAQQRRSHAVCEMSMAKHSAAKAENKKYRHGIICNTYRKPYGTVERYIATVDERLYTCIYIYIHVCA